MGIFVDFLASTGFAMTIYPFIVSGFRLGEII